MAEYTRFPQGIVGVIGRDLPLGERSSRLEELAGIALDAAEVRADLFASGEEALGALREVVAAGVPAIFTVRHAREGGGFEGPEEVRIELYGRALDLGAAALDVEHGTPLAAELSRRVAPLILSHHDPIAMPPPEEMDRLAREMAALPCLAIKLACAARTLPDAASMLEWLGRRGGDDPPRIGLALGKAGFASRILATARGSPVTYASFGELAPGEIGIEELHRDYAPARLGSATRVLGIVGSRIDDKFQKVSYYNRRIFGWRGIDAVCLPLFVESLGEVLEAAEPLRIAAVIVGEPFGEAALAAADEADRWSQEAGAADLLEVSLIGGRARLIARAATIQAVVRQVKRGSRVAVMGTGKLERAAALALLDAGAAPTLFSRDRPASLSRAAGVRVRPAEEPSDEFDEVLELGDRPSLSPSNLPSPESMALLLEDFRKNLAVFQSRWNDRGPNESKVPFPAGMRNQIRVLQALLKSKSAIVKTRTEIEVSAVTGGPASAAEAGG